MKHFLANESAFLTKEASVLLTEDAGLTQIASCFQTNCVCVWGNTVPAFGIFTYGPTRITSSIIHEVKGLRCRPCSKMKII